MLARGETLAAYALTEPETGSDAQHIVTRARLSDDGSEWILNGRKHWIGNGHRAGVIATFAQTEVDEARRDACCARRPSSSAPTCPASASSARCGRWASAARRRRSWRTRSSACRPTTCSARSARDSRVAVHVLNAGRMTLAAGCTDRHEEASCGRWREFTEAARAVRAVRSPTSRSRSASSRARRPTSTRRTRCSASSRSSPSRPEAEYALEAACCKVFASEMLWRAADEMVQLAGGRGFVKPYPYERLLRDSRINRIFEGTNEILRLFIALNGIEGPAEQLKELGVALRRPLKNLGLLSEYRGARGSRSGSARRRRSTSTLHERLQHAQGVLREARRRAEGSRRAADPRVPQGDRRAAAGARAAGRHGDRAVRDGVRARAHAATARGARRGGVRARARALRPVRRRVGTALPREPDRAPVAAGRDAACRGAARARGEGLRRGRHAPARRRGSP